MAIDIDLMLIFLSKSDGFDQKKWFGSINLNKSDYINSTRKSIDYTSSCSIEVKNYDIEKNIDGLINNVSSQAIDRKKHLPSGMQQEVVIDVRGQNLTKAQELKITKGITDKTNGIINSEQIIFKNY